MHQIDIQELLALIGEREVKIHLLQKRIEELQKQLASAISKNDAKKE